MQYLFNHQGRKIYDPRLHFLHGQCMKIFIRSILYCAGGEEVAVSLSCRRIKHLAAILPGLRYQLFDNHPKKIACVVRVGF